jgi:glycosyltransferase involved in cell wall biosynthesis
LIEAAKQRHPGQIVTRLEYVDAATEHQLFSACTAVWVGYRRHYGPSGVLIQAAAAKKPVVTGKEGLLGWQTQHYGLGHVCDPAEPESVAAALTQSLFGPYDPRRASELASRHTEDHFTSTILGGLFGARP